jgi:hypothetical protein
MQNTEMKAKKYRTATGIQCCGTVTIYYGYDFWQVTVPVAAPDLNSKKAVLTAFLLLTEAALLPRNV